MNAKLRQSARAARVDFVAHLSTWPLWAVVEGLRATANSARYRPTPGEFEVEVVKAYGRLTILMDEARAKIAQREEDEARARRRANRKPNPEITRMLDEMSARAAKGDHL